MASRLPALIVLLTALAFAWAAIERQQGYLKNREFMLHASVPCDPAFQACFFAACPEEEGTDCTPAPYAKATVWAKSAPACLEEHSCSAFSCDGREGCTVSFCSDDQLEPAEQCAPPSP